VFLDGHTDIVRGAKELSDGRLLSWSNDQTLRLWDANGAPLTVLEGHTDQVNGTVELLDGRILSCGLDGTLRLWGAKGEALKVFYGDAFFTALTLLDEGQVVAAGDIAGRVMFFRICSE
jgi:WD40 repeat protein